MILLTKHFARFPAIVLELEKIANWLLETIVKRRLKHAFDFVSQRQFVLAHEFASCDLDDDSEDECEYNVIAEAYMGPVVDLMRQTLVAKIESQLFSWSHLLGEPEAITNERTRLRKKMKLMHNACTTIKYYKENTERG